MNERFILPQENKVSILDNVEKQLLLAKKLENVYINRPDMGSFKGVMAGTKFENEYTEESIKNDELYVLERRKQMEESNSSFGRERLDYLDGRFQLSEMFQAMCVDCINKYWFKNCKSIMTSDFDDIASGIDAVVQHKDGGHLGLAFDFTVTNQDKKIYEKLQKGWDKNIKEGKVPTVKYFEDPDTKQKGKLLVPKFIIGASKEDVEQFANSYLSNDIETLENHPFKYLMLLQIEEQLQTVLDYYLVSKGNETLKFAELRYKKIEIVLRKMKIEIHSEEKMYQGGTDLHEYTKSSIALDMMRRFRIMREQDFKNIY